jgi:myo-inositol-1-phosphate synthase
MTIADRISKKTIGVNTKVKKVANLQAQVDMYSNTIERVTEETEQMRSEVDLLKAIQTEAIGLVTRINELSQYTNSLREKFDAIEWSPDLAWEDRIESTDYREKTDEKFELIDQLQDCVKRANKIYYRR